MHNLRELFSGGAASPEVEAGDVPVAGEGGLYPSQVMAVGQQYCLTERLGESAAVHYHGLGYGVGVRLSASRAVFSLAGWAVAVVVGVCF